MTTHGKRSTYTRYGCRCEECTAANTAFQISRKRDRRVPPSHGLSGYDNYNCRCDVCRAAKSVRNRAVYLRRGKNGRGRPMTEPVPSGDTTDPRWRQGTHYPIHVYEGDRPVATFLDAADAAECVRLRARVTELEIKASNARVDATHWYAQYHRIDTDWSAAIERVRAESRAERDAYKAANQRAVDFLDGQTSGNDVPIRFVRIADVRAALEVKL